MKRGNPREAMRNRQGRPTPFRPRLESLESRIVPTFTVPIETLLSSPIAFAARGDFNGDGRQDLAVGDQGIRILLSQGTGAFTQHASFLTTGSATRAVTSGDVNNDGKLDLVVSTSDSTRGSVALQVMLGNGNGTFQLGPVLDTSLLASPGLNYLVVSDFNGDGNLDLALADQQSQSVVRRGTLHVFQGKGDGTFLAPDTYDIGVPTGLELGDVNGDGNTDLIVFQNDQNSVATLLGRGAGLFQPSVGSSLPMDLNVKPSVGDFNGDGKTDIAFGTDRVVKSFAIAEANVDGTFATGGFTPISGFNLDSILIGDFNGDKKLDLIPIGSDSRLYAGNGDGTFDSPESVTTGAFPGQGIAGDFGGDGRIDIAAFQNSPASLQVILNRPTVSFSVTTSAAIIGGTAYQVTVAAKTATGTIDPFYEGTIRFSTTDSRGTVPTAYTFTANDNGVKTFTHTLNTVGGQSLTVTDVNDATVKGNVNLTVVPSTAQPALRLAGPRFVTTGLRPTAIAVGDFNNDSKPDMVVANTGNLITGTGGDVAVSLGNGDGTFRAPTRIVAGRNPTAVAVGDFNGDGKLDFASAALNGSAGADVRMYFGRGEGTFTSPVFYPVATTVSGFTGLYSLAAADFTGDGWTDLAVSSAGNLTTLAGGTVRILVNQGTGAMRANVANGFSLQAPMAMTTGDYNADGKIDLALASRANGVHVSFGTGQGSFTAPVKYNAGAPANAIATGDFNGDGKTDIAALTSTGVQIFRNTGTGQFATPVKYLAGTDPRTLAISDMNGDGKLDLAVTNFSSGKVQLLKGKGDGTFTTAGSFYAGAGVHGIAVVDLNKDGAPDALVSNAGTSTAPGTRVASLLNPWFSQFQFGVISFTANASTGIAVITVKRFGDLTGPATIRYATTDGTAKAGIDYTAVSGVLSFSAGESSKTFTISLIKPLTAKPARTVKLSLSQPTGASTLVLGLADATLTIQG